MTRFAESYAVWLADYYLLATVLLALALAGAAILKQPAQRLAVAKSTLVALLLLAILCAVPGWSVVHLLAAERPPSRVEIREEPFSDADIARYGDRPSQSSSTMIPEQPAPVARVADEVRVTTNAPKIALATLLAIAHLIGTGCILVWLAVGWFASLRLRRAAQPAPANARALLDEVTGINRQKFERLQLFTHDQIDVAVALGIWRPMILLPARWIYQFPLPIREGLGEGSSRDDLRTVLAHESTHILNRDLQWVAVARALFVALWANPLFWLMKRRLRLDQETLADAAAAEFTTRQQYAEQLVAWARDVRSRPAMHLSSAVGLWEGPSQLRQRIAILLDERLTVLRNCSRRWRIASVALCGMAAAVLSLVTLRPGQSAQLPDAQEAKSTESEAAQIESAIKILRETDGLGNDQRGFADAWASQVRRLAEIGKPAAPALIKALDEETRDDAISKLAFALRAVGDPRAVPALIRAIPRTLLPSRSDFVLRVSDPALLKFLQENDDSLGAHHGDTSTYGRAFREVAAALHKLTGTDQGDMELASISLGRTETQQRIERKLFHDLAERWATWWSKNWRRFEVGEAYAAVILPPLKDELASRDAPAREFPIGKQLAWANGAGGLILDSVTETKKHCFFDLDTGRAAGWPKEIPPLDKSGNDLKPILKWAGEQGFDIMGITYQPPGYDAPLYCIRPIEMKVWQITRDEQKELPRAFRREIPLPLGHPVELMIPNKGSAEPYFGTDLGGTPFLFVTREGTAGRLRITAQVTDTNTKALIGKVYTEDDQYSPVGSIRGVKIGLQYIKEFVEPKEPNAISEPAAAPGHDLFVSSDSSQPTAEPKQRTSRPPSLISRGRPNTVTERAEVSIVVAQHVLLLNGNEITTWEEIEAKIAALPDPSTAYPDFYITHGAMASDAEKDAKPHFFELHRKYKLKGHSEGSLSARTSFRYDKIRGKADLIPDESLRVTAVVVDSHQKPVAGAEVVLITPVDESISYKAYETTLVKGRVRNRLDEVVVDTDAEGRFAIFPPKGQKYFVLVLHPAAGFNMVRDQALVEGSKVHLLPWAALVSELGPEPGAKQTASLSTQLRAEDGYPEVNITQYWSDLKRDASSNVFGFTHVPPIFTTSISRDFAEPNGGAAGLNSASVSLLPGESRRIDLGPLSDKQRESLKTLLEESKRRAESLRQK
jgi:beta-lactamase regulating signal transducer with metallopeptidase domain